MPGSPWNAAGVFQEIKEAGQRIRSTCSSDGADAFFLYYPKEMLHDAVGLYRESERGIAAEFCSLLLESAGLVTRGERVPWSTWLQWFAVAEKFVKTLHQRLAITTFICLQ